MQTYPIRRSHPAKLSNFGGLEQKGSNAVQVATRVLEEAKRLQKEVVPDDVEMVVTRNYGLVANEKVK